MNLYRLFCALDFALGNPIGRIGLANAKRKQKPYFGHMHAAGQGNPLRHEWMRRLIRSEVKDGRGKRILEVGSWAGQSAVLWAKEVEFGGSVFCVDSWCPYLGEEKGWPLNAMQSALYENQIYPLFLHNINTSGVSEVINHKRICFELFADTCADKFDLIYLDGDHSKEAVEKDLQIADKLLKPGGVLCGDDLELQVNELILYDFMLRYDYLKDWKSSKHFHPGVTASVGAFFSGSVSVYDGFWCMRKGEKWEKIDLKHSN